MKRPTSSRTPAGENLEESPRLRFHRQLSQVSEAAARIVLKRYGILKSPELDAKALSIAQAVDEAFGTSPE